jgi:hypothetical protein
MKAKFISNILNEITNNAEDEWANTQIDKWIESQRSSKEDYEDYLEKITSRIWNRLMLKLSFKELQYLNLTKESLKEWIDTYDKPTGMYMSISDYWQENIPWEEAANSLFDEVYRLITAQGWAM